MKKKPVAKPVKKTPSKPAVSKAVVSKAVKKPAVAAKHPVKSGKVVKVVKKEDVKDKKKLTPAPIKKAEAKYNPKEAAKKAPTKGAHKEEIKHSDKHADKKHAAAKVEAKAPVKEAKPSKDLKELSKKAQKNNKKNTKQKAEGVELEDDFVPDDDLGIDEIGEYEEELKAVESIDEETEEVEITFEEKAKSNDEEVILTDAEGRRYCRVRECDQASTVDGYCRFHYLLLWKKIQIRKKILVDGKLERYVEELTSRYPDKFLEVIRRDLRTEKDFLAAIQEMEIDESGGDNDFEEDTQSFIEEVRGMGDAPSVDDEEF